jgi:hypothetical protein
MNRVQEPKMIRRQGDQQVGRKEPSAMYVCACAVGVYLG